MQKPVVGITAMMFVALLGFSRVEAVTFTLLEPVGVSPPSKSQPYSKGDEFRIDIQIDASDLPQGVLVNGASICLTIKESKIAPKTPLVPFTDGPYLPVQPTSNTITGDKIIFSELALGSGGSGIGILASITFVVTADTPTSPDTVLWCGLNPNDQLRTDFSRSDQPGSITPTVVPDAGRDVSLPVEFSVFTALSTDRGIILKWRTESETNNLGFNLYRSETPDGTFAKINVVLIKGAGTDATPHDYQFVDEGIQPGKVYYYYIEDVDLSGNTDKSHLIKVGTSTPKGKLITRWGQLKMK